MHPQLGGDSSEKHMKHMSFGFREAQKRSENQLFLHSQAQYESKKRKVVPVRQNKQRLGILSKE